MKRQLLVLGERKLYLFDIPDDVSNDKAKRTLRKFVNLKESDMQNYKFKLKD